MGLAEEVVKGDERSAARLISLIEMGRPDGYKELGKLFPLGQRAHCIGITGAPGAGKSTLVGRLAMRFLDQGKSVGVVAVDPTSIKSSGALLGDRLRMKEAEKRKGVFIRSMADRNFPGGLARAVIGAVCVMEALGKETIMVESVGAGQSDKAIFGLADTVITVFTPDYGDDIQLLKAGLLEIGDIVVVNKADTTGAETAGRAVASWVAQKGQDDWIVPVLPTKAHKGEGIEELSAAIESHRRFLGGKGKGRKAEKVELLLMGLVKEELWERVAAGIRANREFKAVRDAVRRGKVDPYAAVEKILASLLSIVQSAQRAVES